MSRRKKQKGSVSANALRQRRHADLRKARGQKKISIWVTPTMETLVREWLGAMERFETNLQTLHADGKRFPLPRLNGSQKQIEWAMQIRASVLDRLTTKLAGGCESYIAELARQKIDMAPLALVRSIEALYIEDRAAWWIDNRHRSLAELLVSIDQGAIEPFHNEPKPNKIVGDALDEATICPRRIRDIMAEVSAYGSTVRVVFGGFTEGGNKIVRTFGFRFEKPYWERQMSDEAAAANCVTEISNRLISAGHPVRVMDPVLRERVWKDDYTPENLRRITLAKSDKYGTKFRVLWDGIDDPSAQRALAGINGAKIFKGGGGAFVPLEHFEAIEDLIKHSQFIIDDEAQAALEQARARFQETLMIKPMSKRLDQPSVGSLPDSPTHGEIDAELKDD